MAGQRATARRSARFRRSRISPIMMMSGSWRTIERSALANVSPICGCTWIWLMPVDLVLDRVLDRQDLHVRRVDAVERRVQRGGLAGAGRTRSPAGCRAAASELSKRVSVSSAEAELRRGRARSPPRSSMRITTLSPCTVGTVDTRRSISLARTRDRDAAVLRQPALGDVRACAIIFIREMTAAAQALGAVTRRRASTPSTR